MILIQIQIIGKATEFAFHLIIGSTFATSTIDGLVNWNKPLQRTFCKQSRRFVFFVHLIIINLVWNSQNFRFQSRFQFPNSESLSKHSVAQCLQWNKKALIMKWSFVRYTLLFQSTPTINSSNNQFFPSQPWKLINSAVISFIYSVCGYHPVRFQYFRHESQLSSSAPAVDRQWWLITQHCFSIADAAYLGLNANNHVEMFWFNFNLRCFVFIAAVFVELSHKLTELSQASK